MSLIFFPDFPNSQDDPFIITSRPTPTYNCIAWAYGDNTRWYWPDPSNIYFWPNNIPRAISIGSFIELFYMIDYRVCENGSIENGFEKIAIFVDERGIPTHAARLLINGFWTSKLGQDIDVSHSINSIEGGGYGHVSVYMKRPNELF